MIDPDIRPKGHISAGKAFIPSVLVSKKKDLLMIYIQLGNS